MNYRADKNGQKLSVLGFGCMRFKRKNGHIDMSQTEKAILRAVSEGINYFDTAYIYPGSEAALGEIVERNQLRDKIYIATKLPHYLIKSKEKLDEIFNEELSRLRTDHIDYYLMHMLSDISSWERLKGFGIEDWIKEKKESGKIKNIGFSYHGNSDMFCQLVDAYGWDFCMIQYNYMDETTQAGRKGLEYASGKGLPVMIMEPLRGGRLANGLPNDAKRIFESYKTKRSPAEWSFRWLWDQEAVTVVLSGMNSDETVLQNARAASDACVGCITKEDEEIISAVRSAINSKMKVPCTGCRYCMPCPQQVDIPGAFAAYNRYYSDSKFHGLKDYFMCSALRKKSTAASNCVKCGKCELHCPQGIEIRKELENVKKDLEGPLYKTAAKIVKLFTKF
ncbi:MAG: aldo/keto reductase [Ruminococcaceae bacterium]|nr:aldo/keto reductase [Oscillospiraceae bacterium]